MKISFKTLTRRYLEKKALADSLKKEIDELKVQIIDYHKGRDLVTEAGVESKLTHCIRSTIQKEEVEKLLGYEIPSTCYKYSPYDQLKVKIVA